MPGYRFSSWTLKLLLDNIVKKSDGYNNDVHPALHQENFHNSFIWYRLATCLFCVSRYCDVARVYVVGWAFLIKIWPFFTILKVPYAITLFSAFLNLIMILFYYKSIKKYTHLSKHLLITLSAQVQQSLPEQQRFWGNDSFAFRCKFGANGNNGMANETGSQGQHGFRWRQAVA